MSYISMILVPPTMFKNWICHTSTKQYSSARTSWFVEVGQQDM